MDDWDDTYEEADCRPGEVVARVEADVVVDMDHMRKQIQNQVAKRIYDDINKEVTDTIRQGLQDMVNKQLFDVFNRSVTPTDKWGNKQGEPTTVSEMLQRDAEMWLTDMVDYNGRKGSSSYGGMQPRIHWLLREALGVTKNSYDSDKKTELRVMVVAAIREQLGDIKAVVDQEVKETIAEKFKSALK